jgi:hypothetical protein
MEAPPGQAAPCHAESSAKLQSSAARRSQLPALPAGPSQCVRSGGSAPSAAIGTTR